MQHISLTPFGRGPATIGHVAGPATVSCPAVDKWLLLAQVRAARARLGLADRDLAVLHALLSFLPVRDLRDGDPLVVFPSNAALRDRAHGMAESTMRRHLARLVAANLVSRRDSPNGKRFAQRTRSGDVAQAFGLDLRPLLMAAARIAEAAARAEEEASALLRARARVVVMLRDAAKIATLAHAVAPDETVDYEPALHAVRQTLRRKSDAQRLAALEATLAEVLDELRARLDATKASGNDAQSERHLQKSEPETHDLECAEKEHEPIEKTSARTAQPKAKAEAVPPLALVLKACPDIQPYHQGPVRDWRDLVATADQVAPYLGIDSATWSDARTRLGPTRAAATLAAMLQRIASIRNPGGYLRSLVGRFENGRFDPGTMIMALLLPRSATPC
jgi:replication initiation protein RepC